MKHITIQLIVKLNQINMSYEFEFQIVSVEVEV